MTPSLKKDCIGNEVFSVLEELKRTGFVVESLSENRKAGVAGWTLKYYEGPTKEKQSEMFSGQ